MNVLLRFIPCHRMPERSFIINGRPMPLCARCTSILLGYLCLPVLLIFHIQTPIWLGFFFMVPLVIDGYTQKWKWRTSNNLLRFITGVAFGIGQSILIATAIWWLVKELLLSMT